MYKYFIFFSSLLNFVKYLLKGNKVYIKPNASFSISSSSSLKNVKLYVASGARLKINANVSLSNVSICVEKGECIIHDNCIIGSPAKRGAATTNIIINDGSLHVDHHTKLSLDRIWIRFGGHLTIGCYTNINKGSEIRCDEQINIGDYNQISYGVRIWDTNTHTIYDKSERRRITEKYFPYFGYETSKPKTAPVFIGNDCWIGENAALLKGTKLGDEVIVGYNSLLSGPEIGDGFTVVTQTTLKIRKRQ